MNARGKSLYVYLVTLAGVPLRELAGPFDPSGLAREAYLAKDKIEREIPFDRETSKCVVIASQTVERLQTEPEFFDLSLPRTEPLEQGTLVVCRYRLPSQQQPWVAPFWIGVIEEPETDATAWNGRNSEAFYCESQKKARVRYASDFMPSFVEHDSVSELLPVTREQADLPKREKILLFLGPEALRFYDLAS